ncbi:MAG: hypothetical protein IJT75_03000 [Bacteroidaceae bacterium]|nr:hypothetical protein [Bacteroidaceae bacterium]
MTTVTISLDAILQALGFLSNSNKRWLAEHLIEQAAKEETVEKDSIDAERQSDEEFFKDLFSTPLDNPMTAEDMKRVIRENRHSGVTRHIKPIFDYATEPA